MEPRALETELKLILGELEELLLGESTALQNLDRESLDAITDKKLTLLGRLSSVSAHAQPAPEDLPDLKRIRQLALANQLLLVHARDTVRGVLSLALGDAGPLPTPAFSTQPSSGGVRLNVRG